MLDASRNTFQGYARPVGNPGVRNYLLVLNATGLTEPTARRVNAALPGSRFASTPYGMGLLGVDAERQLTSLVGLAANPNVGGVLVLAADRPRCDALLSAIAAYDKPVQSVCYDDVDHDALAMVDTAVRQGARLHRDLSRTPRSSQPLASLVVGLECGLSDPTSGIAANPLLGRLTDWLVDRGATVIMGETLEWLGTESQLSARAIGPHVGDAIVASVLRREELARQNGVSLTDINPNRANIRAGLSTIEEKASGAVAKGGSGPIQSLLGYAQAPTAPGLHLMDAPAYSPESLTGFVAAGAQLLAFSTGVGNSYVSELAPTLKISANDATVGRLAEQIDVDVSDLMGADADQEAASDRLRDAVLETASGAFTWGEVLGEGGECISRFGESL